MALVIMLEFMDEEEAFAYQNDPHLKAVYKRPTLFCEGKNCLPNIKYGGVVVTDSSRGWTICRTCGRYVGGETITLPNGFSYSRFYHRDPSFGKNLIETFRKANVGDRV